jgi:hypothetical protein
MIQEKIAHPQEGTRRDGDGRPSADRFTFPRAFEAMRMAKAYMVTALKDPRILGRKRHLLLLSHPRGFTSLLSHILGSHPEVCGACELLQPYQNRRDLLKSRYRAYWYNDQKASARYFFDKVLFNTYPISDQVLNCPDVQILFAIREPAATIASTVRLGAEDADRDVFWTEFRDPARSCDLYVDRLRVLEEYCMAIKGEAIYFDAEDLIGRTDRVLEVIRDALGLRQPLSEQYRTFDHTGERGGDISERIKSGRIERSKGDRRDVSIPEAILARAQDAYEHCRALMRSRCTCT